MRNLSRKTWLITALVAGVIAAGLIVLTVMFPDGDERVIYSNYVKLGKQMSVEEVEAILGPADKIIACQGGWIQETRYFVGQRSRANRRQRVAVSFGHGHMLYAGYECEYDPTLPRRMADKLEAWFRRLRQ